MSKAVIFDADGTILDTITTISYYVNETLKELGYSTIEEQRYNYLLGYGANHLIKEALREVGAPLDDAYVEKVLNRYNEKYNANTSYLTKAFDGVDELLVKLRKKDCKLAVLSNKPDPTLQLVVEEIFGQGVFDIAMGQMENIRKKPDPEGVNLILEKLGIDRTDTYFIGDTEVDIETGKNAQVKTIGVTWGFRTEEEVRREKPDYLAREVSEILDIIGG